MQRLVVSIDAVARLAAAAAGRSDFDLAAAASLAGLGGAAAVRASVAEDLRPIGESEVLHLRRVSRGLELRVAAQPSLLKTVLEARPDRVVIAGESWDGEAGAAPLDLRTQARDVQPMLRALEEAGIDAALLVAPDIASVKAGHKLGARGLELFTGATVDLPREERVAALDQLGDAGRLASKLRLRVSLAGSLDDLTLPEVLARVPSAECVAVGRAFSSRALLVGVERAVRDLRALLG
jgi:pyridoxine 5-phosphate synthase